MVYNRFFIGIIIRVGLLSLSIFGETWLLVKTDYVISPSILAGLILLQIYLLIRYTERTRRELAHFLDSIKYEDFLDTIPPKRRRHEEQLNQAFTRIIRDFQQVRSQREEQLHYIDTIVQHISIGILCYDTDGNVDLINTSARRMMGVFQLKNINDLDGPAAILIDVLRKISPGERQIVSFNRQHSRQQLILNATAFRRNAQQYSLLSLQDIHSELEEKEMEAWQNLMRVLTHEIRNSITPIASLAGTADDMLCDISAATSENPALQDIHLAVQTIHRRSEGLLKFTEDFRSLYQVPRPTFGIVSVKTLLDYLVIFFRPRIEQQGVSVSMTVDPETLEITADRQLLEQVFINLILNSLDALRERSEPRLEIHAYLDQDGKVSIDITDNGAGILPNVLERIFIPFFTTKKEGSGIGLALSRQIMRLHRGTIQVFSQAGQGATFRLKF